MKDYDVVVVGARVAGAATAMLLARSGLRVALLDRGGYGTDAVSTHALMRAGVLQLSRWGLLDRVRAAGTPPVRRTRFHYAGTDPLQVTIRARSGVDALYAPRRWLLDRILVDAAGEAGADVLHRATVTGLLRGRDGRVGGVRVTRPGEGTWRVPGALTIGADGIASVVARDAGAPVVRQGRSAGAVLYRYVTGVPNDGYDWAFAGHAAAGVVATNAGEGCLFVSAAPERMRTLRAQGVDAAFQRLLAEMPPAFRGLVSGAVPAGPVRGWRGLPGMVRQPWGSGWALVGDAGYYKDPITAHGITDALRDAELLAAEAVQLLSGATPGPVALSRYQRTRDRLSRPLLEVTEEVAGYAWDDHQVQTLLRRVSASMSDEVEHLERLGGGAGHRRLDHVDPSVPGR